MPDTNYTPQIGETVIVSLSGNHPMCLTVTGFHYHTYLKKDVMDFERKDGRASWTDPDGQAFFTEIPADTPFFYVVTAEAPDGYDNFDRAEDSWFFSPEEAFAHIARLKAGEAKPNHPFGKDADYSVVVEQLT